MATTNLLDVAKLNGNDTVVGLIEENLNVAPEVNIIPARTIRGTSYTTGVRSAYPGVGFRAANAATTPTKSTFEKRLVECFILSAIVQADKAVAMAYEDGAEAWQAIEANGVIKQALIEIGQQIFYGTATTLGAVGNADGFPGFLQLWNTSIVVDAGGTTASTGSSVWAVRRGIADVNLVFGNGDPMNLSDFRVETISNIPSFVADLTGWIGLQSVNNNAVGRIKKLTADSGKGLTDSLIANLISQFPVGSKPDILFMSRRSAFQLQTSRSAVGNIEAGGGGRPGFSAYPVSSNDLPIVVTDSIVDTEGLTL